MKLLIATLLLVSVGGCRYQDTSRMGRSGPAPFVNLQCTRAADEEGFSFEVPSCLCNAGIRLRYRASRTPSGLQIRYVQEVGFRTDDPADDVRMTSARMDRLEDLTLGDEQISSDEPDDSYEAAIWRGNRDVFRDTWRNYEPVIRDLLRVCAEDRVDV